MADGWTDESCSFLAKHGDEADEVDQAALRDWVGNDVLAKEKG